MRITSAGNVGIGTDSPSTMLEVRNSTGLAKIKIRGDDGATSTRAELHIDRTDDVRGGGVRIESSGGALNQWFIESYNGGSSSVDFQLDLMQQNQNTSPILIYLLIALVKLE